MSNECCKSYTSVLWSLQTLLLLIAWKFGRKLEKKIFCLMSTLKHWCTLVTEDCCTAPRGLHFSFLLTISPDSSEKDLKIWVNKLLMYLATGFFFLLLSYWKENPDDQICAFNHILTHWLKCAVDAWFFRCDLIETFEKWSLQNSDCFHSNAPVSVFPKHHFKGPSSLYFI